MKIGAHQFKIVEEETIGIQDDHGKSSMVRLEIYIRKDSPKSLRHETLCHEALHIIRELHAIDRDDIKEEERRVQIMGHAWYQWMRDNKKLILEMLK